MNNMDSITGCFGGPQHSDAIFQNEEEKEWAMLSPVQRYLESCKLWTTFLTLGGSLDPEPDSQSPFDFPELQRAVPADGRSGVHFIRRG